MATVLSELFKLQLSSTQRQAARYTLATTQPARVAATFGSAEQATLTITVDRRTNSLLVGGTREYVELVYAFLNGLGILHLRVPLVGHALGATVAVDFARQYPQHVDRVLAVSLPLTGAAVNRRLLTQGLSLIHI